MKTKILIVEHDLIDIELIQRELSRNLLDYVSLFVHTEKEFVKALNKFKPDIILSDYSFPVFDGLSAFGIKQQISPQVPFILVTGAIGEEILIELIKKGVTDYLLKDNLLPLVSKINRALSEAKDKAAVALANERNGFKAQLLNNIGQAVMSTNLQGIVQFWNRAAEKIFGWSTEEAVGCNVMELIPSQLSKEQAVEIIDQLHKGNTWSGEIIMQRKDGSSLSVFLNDSPIYDQQGNLCGIIGIATDLTQQKKAEEDIAKANRIYSFLSQINQNIVATKNIEGLLQNSCEIAVEFGKYKMAWIGLIDTKNKAVKLIHHVGVPEHELENFNDVYFEPSATQDYVLKTGERFICNDIQKQVGIRELKAFAAKHDIHSCVVLPIRKSGNIIGTFNLYSDRPQVHDVAEIALLEEVANEVSFALDSFEKERKHKAAEQKIVENEKRYRNLFENNPVPMWVFDPGNFRFLDVNKMAIRQYGYSRKEFMSMTVLDIRPEEDRELFRELYRSSKKDSNNSNKGIFNHRTKSGIVIKVEIIAHDVDFEGIPARFILANDVTIRTKTKENLVRSESRLKEAQSIARLGNWEVSFETCIAYWSEETCKIYGLKPDENKQTYERWLSFIHPDDMDFVMDITTRSLISLEETEYIHRIVLKDGSIKHINSHSKYQYDKNGKPIGCHGIVHDVTERTTAKLALVEQNAELTKTNSELDRFVYSVSHDLRSPLTSVLGLVSLIEDDTREPATLELSKMIRTSINRLDGFIKNILTYSQNNRTDLQIEKISVTDNVNTIIKTLQDSKEAKGIHFEVNCDEKDPFYSDWQRFNIVIENLISNAIKYHKKEQGPGRHIKISGSCDKDKLALTITDNGTGIATRYQSKVFDMFFRISGESVGSGLGLYIVKETVEKIHGNIQLRSKESVGTTFSISLKNLKSMMQKDESR